MKSDKKVDNIVKSELLDDERIQSLKSKYAERILKIPGEDKLADLGPFTPVSETKEQIEKMVQVNERSYLSQDKLFTVDNRSYEINSKRDVSTRSA